MGLGVGTSIGTGLTVSAGISGGGGGSPGAPLVLVNFANTTVFPAGGMTPTAFAAAMPSGSGLFYSSASTGGSIYSVQTSASTAIANIPQAYPRFGSFSDANRQGLAIEQASTNIVFSSGYYFTAGGATITTGQADPAGGTSATRVQCPSGDDASAGGPFAQTNGVAYVYSEWDKQGSVGGMFCWYADGASVVGTAPSTWTRQITYITGTGPYYNPNISNGLSQYIISVTGWTRDGVTPAARDVVQWGVQCEPSFVPTSYINAVSAAASRAADLLGTSSFGAWVNSSGRLNLELVWTPCAPFSQYDPTTNIPLLWRDANTNIVIQMPSGTIAITIGGLTTTLGAITWANAGDVIDFNVQCGGGSLVSSAFYRVMAAGGTTWSSAYSLGQSVAAQPAWTTAGTFYFGSDGTSTHLNALLGLVASYA